MNNPIYLEQIDWRIKPIFNLSVVAARKNCDERLYRCRTGVRTINDAYHKLQDAYRFSWWIAEHAYRGTIQRERSEGQALLSALPKLLE